MRSFDCEETLLVFNSGCETDLVFDNKVLLFIAFVSMMLMLSLHYCFSFKMHKYTFDNWSIYSGIVCYPSFKCCQMESEIFPNTLYYIENIQNKVFEISIGKTRKKICHVNAISFFFSFLNILRFIL